MCRNALGASDWMSLDRWIVGFWPVCIAPMLTRDFYLNVDRQPYTVIVPESITENGTPTRPTGAGEDARSLPTSIIDTICAAEVPIISAHPVPTLS
jgi:hypothetical protein